MNRIEFMNELEFLLQDITEEEKQEALQYYNDYFDEAGSDNEAALIGELESPAKVAAIIKDGLGEEAMHSGEFSETGYADERFSRKQEIDRRTYLKESGYSYQNFREQRRTGQHSHDADSEPYEAYNRADQSRSTSAKVLLIVLICLLAIPVGSVLIAIGAAMIGMIFGLGGALVALLVAGVALIGSGIGVMFSMPSAGLAISGAGLILAALGLALVVLVVWLVAEALPALGRALRQLYDRVTGRRGERR